MSAKKGGSIEGWGRFKKALFLQRAEAERALFFKRAVVGIFAEGDIRDRETMLFFQRAIAGTGGRYFSRGR